jgi:GT2 family glycosyltransferase
VLLNNDTEIIQPEWLERMIGIAQRPEVGAVGIRLVYPGKWRIQHAASCWACRAVLSVADHVFEKPNWMRRAI